MNLTTIEDILANMLGLVLGAPPGPEADAGQINNGYRPASIKGPGFWLIAQKDNLFSFNGWSPEYNKEAITFYKYDDARTGNITRVTVWVGITNRDNAQGQTHNTTNPYDVVNAEANPVIAVGSAWERIANEIPHAAGPGTPFDPTTLVAVKEVLTSVSNRASTISAGLNDDLKKLNVESDDFKGSAESAWRHHTMQTDSFLHDIGEQFKRWDGGLAAAGTAMTEFINNLLEARERWWNTPPGGVWHNPYRVIAAMFNDSTLDKADVLTRPDGESYSDAWNSGNQYTDQRTSHEVMWRPPAWLGLTPINAFHVPEWSYIDYNVRQKFADNIIKSFQPVLGSAEKLVEAIVGARNKFYIDAPAPVPPPPMPNNTVPNNLFPNFDNLFPNDLFANWGFPNNPFANIGSIDDPFANVGSIGNPFANVGSIGDPFANIGGIGNPFANIGGIGDPFANLGGVGNPFANMVNPFAHVTDPFANGPGSSDPGSSGPGANWLNPFAPRTMGDLTPTQLSQLDRAGLLDNNPLTPAQKEFLQANGLGVPPGDNPTLGDLNELQRNALQQAGLLDNVPLDSAEQSALGLDKGPGGRSGFGVDNGLQPVPTNPFPTTVDGLDVSNRLPNLPDQRFGDVTRPGAATFPENPGVAVGTGGLGGLPGMTGSPGAFSPSNLGQALGGGAGAATGTGATGTAATSPAGGMPMMPFMPPMMPGMYGGMGNQERERTRNTWLKEDEEVWGTDPKSAPAVIGKRGKPSKTELPEDRPVPGTERTDDDERRWRQSR